MCLGLAHCLFFYKQNVFGENDNGDVEWSFGYIFGKDIYSVYKEQIKDNIAKGLLWQNGTRIALTDRGIDISNTVMSDFV